MAYVEIGGRTSASLGGYAPVSNLFGVPVQACREKRFAPQAGVPSRLGGYANIPYRG